MNISNSMYDLSLDQICNAILRGGHKRTVFVEGDMGTGKSSLLKMLAQLLPTHAAMYFDSTTKDLGDITIPNIKMVDDTGCVSYLTNEELGVHLNKPIILMIDEYGKANPTVKNALLRLMLERKIGSYELTPDSIVFATSNKGAEGVGDLLQAHQCNRISKVRARKPSNMEWIEWGINNGVDHTLLGWCKDNPQLFQSFEDVKDPDDNPYIFHPRQQRAHFVTPRSLEAASDWLKEREHIDDQSMTSLLMGTIGERGAMDLMAFVKLADQLPTLQDIKDNPDTAKVPTSASAVCMVVYRTLASLEKDWLNQWMDYLVRLDAEAQGMFANGVRAEKYHNREMVFNNAKFTAWCTQNNHMFAGDKI